MSLGRIPPLDKPKLKTIRPAFPAWSAESLNQLADQRGERQNFLWIKMMQLRHPNQRVGV